MIALGALALGIAPATSAAVTIDFESVSHGDTVNVQYNSQGVTFNGPKAYDYDPGLARSPTKGVEFCRGVEFCPTVQLRADFTTEQAAVGIWLGVNAALAAPLDVRLTAFDGGGGVVGTADAAIPASPNPTPANTQLEVTLANPAIRSIEVGPAGGGSSYDLFFDDLEFTVAGPPPPCTASGPPTLTFSQAFQDATLQNNSMLISGFVNERGAPITDARAVSQGATTRSARFFPTPIDADGGPFAITMNGLLQQGQQTITLTATNCAGTTTSSPRTITHTPLPADTRFQQLGQIEVTQTVQAPFNPVPLIAGGPNGTKRTIARVYLSAEGSASQVSGVSGRLTAIRPDGSRPGGPLTIDSLNTITVPAGQTFDAARSSLDTSLNFELPAEWLTEGRLHLQLEQLKIEGTQSTFPCDDCDNPLFQSPTGATVTFQRVPPLRVWLVGVPFTPAAGGGAVSPRQKDFDFLASWLRRAYPASEVQITQAALPVSSDQPGFVDDDDDGVDENRDGFLCDDVQDRLSQWAATMPAQPTQTRYYGVVADTGGMFMRGCASIGGRFGSGPAGDGNFGWDFDGAYTDWYGGHELGHSFNRKHPGSGCGESDDDDSFPFIAGAIGNFAFDNQGIDVGDATLSPAQSLALYDWRTGWQDVMTYCEEQWLSSYTYSGILKNLCGKDKPNCPSSAVLGRRRVGASAPAAKAGGGKLRLAVNGSLNLRNNRVQISPMSALKGLTLTQRPKKSEYAIVLRGERGNQIARYRFEPKELSDLPAGRREASINEVVPFSGKAARIEIVEGKRRLFSKRVSAHAPTVRLLSPKVKKLKKPVKVRWRSRDADGGGVTATVQYAADGKRFVTLAAGLRKQSLRVDPDELPGGKKARFRVVVTDGVLTGVDASRKLKVEAKPPQVSIASPVAGATFTAGETVQLMASVTDEQDTRVGDDIVWSSSVQGEPGRGAALSTKLEPGTHVLTASTTNRLGKTGTATISVEVEAVPETIDAALVTRRR